MNTSPLNRLLIVNLGFWAAALAFPYFARLLPTASGSPPRIYDVLVPLIQIMFAAGSTYLLKTAIDEANKP